MHADDDGHRQRLTAPFHFVVQGPEVPADRHENAQLAFARHHKPVVARVSHAGIRIGGNDDAGGNVRGSIDIIVGEQRDSG